MDSRQEVEIAKGVFMPNFGFGTSGLTGVTAMRDALDAAIGAGYRLIDTADFYENEEDIGAVLSDVLTKHKLTRSDVFIQTKFHTYDDETALDALTRALKRLGGLEYIDSFLVHYPYPGPEYPKPLNLDPDLALKFRTKVWGEMESILEKGLARAIGVSNYEIKHLEQLKSYAKVMPAINQLEFHPHLVRPELIKYCRDNNIYVQGYTTMGRQNPALLNEPVLQKIAQEHKLDPRQVLLAWSLNQGVGIIPKSSKAERIKFNLQATKIQLSKSEIQELSALDRHQEYTLCAPWTVP